MRKKVNKKLIVALLSFVLLFGGTFGSSLAWLLDNTEDVTNTFTTSNIEITLDESKLNEDGTLDTNIRVYANDKYKMVPGHTIAKDPKVTVDAKSEPCWLFVKIDENLGKWSTTVNDKGETESVDFKTLLKYEVEDDWTHLNTTDGNLVYYRAVDDEEELATASTDGYKIIKDDTITVSEDITKEMMEDINASGATKPTLIFTAAAVQYYKTQGTPLEVDTAYAQVEWPAS